MLRRIDRLIVGGAYANWVRSTESRLEAGAHTVADHLRQMGDPPLISVIVPVYNTPAALLEATIESVKKQVYPHWELCIADDGSPAPHVAPLLNRLAADDPRIKVTTQNTNGQISRATNAALALAQGSFVAMLDHDDLLHERALYEVAAELERHPDADILFTDEDRIDRTGTRGDPHFKPGWNPDLLLGYNYVNHLTVYRRSLVERLGGLRPAYDGSQDYDLLLRATAATTQERIRHIPRILYHWRRGGTEASFSQSARERCLDAAQRALRANLGAQDAGVEILPAPGLPDWWRIRRSSTDRHGRKPLVSVIIPTRDSADLLAVCLRGLLHETDYPAIEVLIADNGSREAATLALFETFSSDERLRVIDCSGPFNFSAINNKAAKAARGEILLLLNNDIEVGARDWLDELVSHAVRPEVGAVGAKLLYPDGRVQHAGIALGVGADAVAGHVFHGLPGDHPGYFGYARLTRNVSAVTGACLAIRRSLFEAAGGLDADNLAVAFNDVDLCLKVREKGFINVWTPYATLIHHESATRGPDTDPAKRERFAAEVAYMRRRWGPVLDADPYDNPNFFSGSYRLAPTPRGLGGVEPGVAGSDLAAEPVAVEG